MANPKPTLLIPYEVYRRAEAKRAASASYWRLTKRLAKERANLDAVARFLRSTQ